LLAACDVEGLKKAGFYLILMVWRECQQQLAFEPIDLWLVLPFVGFVRTCQRFHKHSETCCELSHDLICLGCEVLQRQRRQPAARRDLHFLALASVSHFVGRAPDLTDLEV
jgi:hypothetical protein